MIDKILVPTDGSEGSLEAASYAASLARAFSTRVTILHVVEIPQAPLPPSIIPMGQSERARQELLRAGQAILEMTRKVFDQAHVTAEIELQEGRPPNVIADLAAAGGHDLIVIGSRGVGAVARLLLGSVSEEVARIAPCPVLIVRKGVRRLPS